MFEMQTKLDFCKTKGARVDIINLEVGANLWCNLSLQSFQMVTFFDKCSQIEEEGLLSERKIRSLGIS